MAKAKERVAPGIYKAAPGVYDLTVSTGMGPDGKYGQVTRRVRGTLTEAKTERGRILAEVQDGKVTGALDITMAELHRRFMTARPKLAAATKHQYEYIWTKLGPHIGNRPVRKLKAMELDHAYTAVLGDGVGANTVRKCHKHAGAILRQAVRWELCQRNVAESATPPESEPFDVVPPTPEDLRKLVDQAFLHDRDFGVLVYLGATTGARRGELAGLRWCDVDEDGGTVRFQSQPDDDGDLHPLKNKRGRTVYVDDATVTILREHRAHCERIAQTCGGTLTDKCFVGSPIPGGTEPFLPKGLTNRFRTLREATGIECRLHDLRHAKASSLLIQGVSPAVVAERLGHSSPTITLAIYAHSNADAARIAAAKGGLNTA